MPEAHRHITAEETQGVLVLTIIEKRIDNWELAESLRKEIVDVFSAGASNKVVVNLNNVEYMSSVGYGSFLGLKKRVQQTDGRLVLCNLSDFITELFDKTRLLMNPRAESSSFVAVASVSDAIAELNADS